LLENRSYFIGQGLQRQDVDVAAVPVLDIDALLSDLPLAIGPDASREVALSGERTAEMAALSAARRRLAEGKSEEARNMLALALRSDSKSRPLRALFHVALGVEALRKNDGARAVSQLENALLYDGDCREAASILDLIRARVVLDDTELTRLFQ